MLAASGIDRAGYCRISPSISPRSSAAVNAATNPPWLRPSKAAVLRRYSLVPLTTQRHFLLSMIPSIKDTLAEIYQAELQFCVYDAFYQVMKPPYGADPAECYEARFYSYGLFGLLDEWIKRGFCETPAQITALFQRMMNGQG